MKANVSKVEELQRKLSGLSEYSTEKVDVLNKLAKSHLGKSNTKAQAFSKRALKIAEKINYSKGEVISLNTIGISYYHLYEYEKAIGYYQKTLRKSEENNDKHFLAASLNNIGIIYSELNNHDKAIEYYQKALKLFKENNDIKSMAAAMNNIGSIYRCLKKFDKSLEYGLKSLKLYKEIGSNKDIVYSINSIGKLYRDIKNYKKAIEYFQEAIKISEQVGEKDVIAIASNNLGESYLQLENYKKAFLYLKKVLKIAKQVKSKNAIKASYNFFSDLYASKGDYKKSLEYFKFFITIKDEILNKASNDKIAEIQEKYEIEKKEKEIEFLQKENELYKKQIYANKKLEKVHLEIKKKNETIKLISRELENSIEKDFIGTSDAIKSVLEFALIAAKHKDTHILVTGENGTGKEIIARIIHYASDRKKEAFLPVNCSAIPETLLESEFFGHRKGAYTGATENKKGLFEMANEGTLFLDEIADMPLSLQAKILRAIEEKKIKRIGENDEIQIDVRIISATNRNIKELVDNKDFRIDLYYRINTFEINIPPLSERPEDIEPLMTHFIKFFARKMNKPVPKVSSKLIQKLQNYHFPGNVRELKNLVERAMILSKNDILELTDFPLTFKEVKNQHSNKDNINGEEITAIKHALITADFHQNKTAEILGISRTSLNRKIKKYNINIKKVIE
ncbi:MAG: sigma 54-interacting transcriptional regulator [Candidatus Cloacimonetes bacterium]|nr:sigma 54-interacting transcriptional regulator [Candidatus Cloacimonadota bacterium]